jgi:hypothetical protein
LEFAILAIVCAALVTGASSLTIGGKTEPGPTWKVLVYLVGDNSLDTVLGGDELGVVETDLAELMAVGTTGNVDVYTVVDWYAKGSKLFQVWPGELEEIQHPTLNNVELNMGDPAVLSDFLEFASGASDAPHTMLLFWDHGSPYYIAWDDHVSETSDEADALTHKEVITALSGQYVDIIGADECLVGQTEVAYEYALSGSVGYLLASECYTGWRGFAYDEILAEIDDDPTISPEDLSAAIAEQFTEMLSTPAYMVEMVNSKTAANLSEMQTLVDSLGILTGLLCADIEDLYSKINSARGKAELYYGTSPISRVDLGVFVQELEKNVKSTEIGIACASVLEAYSKVVLAIGTSKATEGAHTGLGVYLPTTPNHSLEVSMLGADGNEYIEYAFSQQGWMDFLEAFWGVHGS